VQHVLGVSFVVAVARASHWQPGATDAVTVKTAVTKLTAVSLCQFSVNGCHAIIIVASHAAQPALLTDEYDYYRIETNKASKSVAVD